MNQASKGYDRKKAAFSDIEDDFIRKGISKDRYGQVTATGLEPRTT